MDFIEPDQPSWLLALRDDVDRAFAVTGAGTPGWADPYPDRDAPDSTYSVCADPGKYRILETRLDAWISVLERHGLATSTETAPIEARWARVEVRRVRRLDPARSGGLALVGASTRFGTSETATGMELGVAGHEPGGEVATLELLPDCGCDHCDSGSEDLLGQLDEWVMTVARGGVLHVRHGGATMTRTWDGWQGNGSHPDTWLDDPASVPPGAVVWRGEPWRTG